MSPRRLNETERRDGVRQAVGPHPMPLDEIARAAGLNPAQCSAVARELELAGEALSYPGGLLARAV
ncbi:hypothetical protein [Hyphomonas sp.]|uniref:DprA-like winged helix domain-containing protein n=1 Tax=Hyphomonas sp. TaxID=87 RepID=UPI0025BD1FFD|nr:hypothetical protein [Hyphomonas sp.]MBI1400375.1 hypothetical protein [Hyphomonas sp.]